MRKFINSVVPFALVDTISAYKVLGERLMSSKLILPGGTLNLQIALKDDTSGVYFVTITSGKGIQTPSVLKC